METCSLQNAPKLKVNCWILIELYMSSLDVSSHVMEGAPYMVCALRLRNRKGRKFYAERRHCSTSVSANRRFTLRVERKRFSQSSLLHGSYLTVILRGRAGYELIYITHEAVGRVGYYPLISGKSEKNNCFSKFSSNSLDVFGWNLLKSWHFLYRRRRENIFSDLQNFSTRNSSSVFPYLVKLNDNGSYHGLREPIRKLENHYPELKIY